VSPIWYHADVVAPAGDAGDDGGELDVLELGPQAELAGQQLDQADVDPVRGAVVVGKGEGRPLQGGRNLQHAGRARGVRQGGAGCVDGLRPRRPTPDQKQAENQDTPLPPQALADPDGHGCASYPVAAALCRSTRHGPSAVRHGNVDRFHKAQQRRVYRPGCN